MAKVFISYRRADSAAISGRIYDRLVARFKRKNVFKDVDDIPAGVDFGAYIRQSVRECAVILVVIGPRWLDARTNDGARRLDDPGDWVRIEIETALTLGLIIIPLLVESATMPNADELPASLREVAGLNALPVRNDPDFTHDMERVVAAIERIVSAARPTPGIFRRGAASRSAQKQPVPEPPAQLAQPAQPDPTPTPAPSPAVVVVESSPGSAAQSPVAESPRKARVRRGTLAVVAVVLIVVSIGVLFSRGIAPAFSADSNRHPTQTPNAHATQTASIQDATAAAQQYLTATAPTATPASYPGELPLVAAAPGAGCEQGGLNGFWEAVANWSETFCHGKYTHMATVGSSSGFVIFDFYDARAHMRIRPGANYTISVQMRNLSANGEVGFSIEGAVGSADAVYSITVNSSSWAAGGTISPQTGSATNFALGNGWFNNPATHTLTFSFHGPTVALYLDGVRQGSRTDDTTPPVIDRVQMQVYNTNGPQSADSASVDFSNFRIAAA